MVRDHTLVARTSYAAIRVRRPWLATPRPSTP